MTDEGSSKALLQPAQSHEQTVGLLGKLFEVAQPQAVFGAPIKRGDTTIITASEVAVGMGVGQGSGSRSRPRDADGPEESGGGGGGGGGATGRPVAIVRIAADGHVDVKPVIDLTKLGIAACTALGTMLLMRARMGS